MKLSAARIKLVAIITMLIDHMTEVIVGLGMLRGKIFQQFTFHHSRFVYGLYWIGRGIGRIAYPLFAYFIVEGFLHTKSKGRYAFRLFIFALISELPFDMAFNGGWLEMGYQNVYFNLLIGLLTIWILEEIQKRYHNNLFKFVCMGFVIACGCYIAEVLLHCDYGYIGVLAIAAMYLLREQPKMLAFGTGVLILSIFNNFEAVAFIDLPLIKLYDGTRGKQNKYFFYLFYPIHLLLLGLLLRMYI